MKKKKYISVVMMSLILVACVPQTPATEIPPTKSGSNSIGTIERVSDQVDHNQGRVTDIEDLFQNDSLRMFDGGEGLLDFGSDMRLRMFNDTELGGIRTANDPGSPLDVQLTLFAGGFIGQLFREESQVVFKTPNEARIHVFATTFVLVYDRESRVTLCANIEGDVRVESAGSGLISIPPGEIYQVQADGDPEYFGDVPWTPAEYVAQARADESPLTPFGPLPISGRTPTETSMVSLTPTPPTLEPTTPVPLITFTPTHTPTKTPIPCPPKLTVIQNAFCREGPSQAFREIDSFVVGEQLQVEGRNNNETWWWVQKHTRGNCWISDVTVEKEGDSSCLEYINPPPTYTPTPTITLTPTLTATFCPMLALKDFEAYDYPQRFVYWNAVGGCGPFSGTLTARYEGESSPYATIQISNSSGTYDDSPPTRCEGTFTIVYTITLKDGAGQVVTESITMDIIWIC